MSQAPPTTHRRTAGTTPRDTRWWFVGGAILVIIIAGSLYYGLARAGGPSVNATVTDCERALPNPYPSSSPPYLSPPVVGLGSVASLGAIDNPA